MENVLAVFFILTGIFMVVALGKYGTRTRARG
jgi:putative membrane protein